MSKRPYFQFYASDWLGSNRRAAMSLEQQGAYINLLARQWADPTCSLPDDDVVLARLSELGQGWLDNGCLLVRECFPKHPTLEGRIANARLLKLRAEYDAWVEKSRRGGRKSAAIKKLQKAKGGSELVQGWLVNGKKKERKEVPRKERKKKPSPSPSSNSKTPLNPPRGKSPQEQAFDEWWSVWPSGKKVGKQAAWKAYKAAVKRICTDRDCEPDGAYRHLQERLAAFVGTPKCLGPYCPHPSTWLNEGRYDDDPSAWQDSGRGRQPPPSNRPNGRVF